MVKVIYISGGSKRNISDAIEQKIEKDQAKVIKTKAAYDIAVKDLQILPDKRDAQREDFFRRKISGSYIVTIQNFEEKHILSVYDFEESHKIDVQSIEEKHILCYN